MFEAKKPKDRDDDDDDEFDDLGDGVSTHILKYFCFYI